MVASDKKLTQVRKAPRGLQRQIISAVMPQWGKAGAPQWGKTGVPQWGKAGVPQWGSLDATDDDKETAEVLDLTELEKDDEPASPILRNPVRASILVLSSVLVLMLVAGNSVSKPKGSINVANPSTTSTSTKAENDDEQKGRDDRKNGSSQSETDGQSNNQSSNEGGGNSSTATTEKQLTTQTLILLANGDILKDNVLNQSGSLSSLYKSLNEDPNAINDSTYVRSISGEYFSKHVVSFPQVTGTVTKVTAHVRTNQGTATGTFRLQLWTCPNGENTNLLGDWGDMEMPGSWTTFNLVDDDSFVAFAPFSGMPLCTKINLDRTSATGTLRYSAVWLEVTTVS